MTRRYYVLVGAVTLLLSCSTTAIITHLARVGIR